MSDYLQVVDETLALIKELNAEYEITSADAGDPLLYSGVVGSDVIAEITPTVEKYFGRAFKPAGQGAFLKNIIDGFTKDIGGIRKEQTVFRKQVSASLNLYCAFWPWGSDPIKTTVRIGVLCDLDEASEKDISVILKKHST